MPAICLRFKPALQQSGRLLGLFSLLAGLSLGACAPLPNGSDSNPDPAASSGVASSPDPHASTTAEPAVRPQVSSLELRSPSATELAPGQSLQLQVQIRDAAGQELDPASVPLHWSSQGAVQVDEQGWVQVADSVCTATVTVSHEASGQSASLNLNLCAGEQGTTQAPQISWISANSGLPGQTLLIAGAHLAETQSVDFNGTPAQFVLVSDNLLRATVPGTAGDGPISVTTPYGTAASGQVFDNQPLPDIQALDPASGQPGEQIHVHGRYFLGVGFVYLNGHELPFQRLSDTELVFTIPEGAEAGTITLTNGVGSSQSAQELEIVTRIWYVKAGSRGNGSSWDTAFGDLQQALHSAKSGEEIWVAEGTYLPSDKDREQSFDLIPGVRVYGGFAGDESHLSERNWLQHPCILSGDLYGNDLPVDHDKPENIADNSEHVVRGADHARLDGFIIEKGASESEGGGIWTANASENLVFSHLMIRDNYAAQKGGGMFNLSASPRLQEVFFLNNLAGNKDEFGAGGGGLYNQSASPVMNRVLFYANEAYGHGGGIYNHFSRPQISNGVFTLNTAFEHDGGGIYNESSDVELSQSTFYNNRDRSGKNGIYNRSSNPLLRNLLLWQSEIENVQSSAPKILNTLQPHSNPFVSISDLDGPDDRWFTADDGLRLSADATTVIDQGLSADDLPQEDVLGRPRDAHPDPGAYEYF